VDSLGLPLSFHYSHVVLPSSIALCFCTPCCTQMEALVFKPSPHYMWLSREQHSFFPWIGRSFPSKSLRGDNTGLLPLLPLIHWTLHHDIINTPHIAFPWKTPLLFSFHAFLMYSCAHMFPPLGQATIRIWISISKMNPTLTHTSHALCHLYAPCKEKALIITTC
jgi:hypothetical protein